MSINFGEWMVLIVLALALVGPNRLPEYATTLARLIRRARDFALGAREQVRAELGPEFDEVDWRKYDPRRYHPRQIVRNALTEAWEGADDDDPPARPSAAVKPVSATMAGATTPVSTVKPATVSTVKNNSAGPAAKPTPAAVPLAAARPPLTRPARTPRPAAVVASGEASPAPSTWADAAKRVSFDADAT